MPSEPDRFIEALQANHATEERMVRAAWWGLVLVTIFCAAWLSWKLWVDWEIYVRTPLAGFIGVGGTFAILLGVLVQTIRRSRQVEREGVRIDAIVASYEAESSAAQSGE